METTRFTANIKKIDELTSKFKEIKIINDNWSIEYINPIDNSKWLKMWIETERHGGGHPVLIKLPKPTKAELIDIALTSKDIDEIATSSALLASNEQDFKEQFRLDLIERLENHFKRSNFIWTDFERERVKTIIYDTNLYSDLNRKSTVGKHISEIEEDYKHYKSLSDRAKKLLKIVENK